MKTLLRCLPLLALLSLPACGGDDTRAHFADPRLAALQLRLQQMQGGGEACDPAALQRTMQMLQAMQAMQAMAGAAGGGSPADAWLPPGDNFWAGRFGSGNHNADNSQGYVHIPGHGAVTYGF